MGARGVSPKRKRKARTKCYTHCARQEPGEEMLLKASCSHDTCAVKQECAIDDSKLIERHVRKEFVGDGEPRGDDSTLAQAR